MARTGGLSDANVRDVDCADVVAHIHPSWLPALEAVLADVLPRIMDELAGQDFLPAPDHIFRALEMPLGEVRVVIVGQDPYPTPGHAMGLAFSTQPGVPAPKSLRNIYTELKEDVGLPNEPGRPGGLGEPAKTDGDLRAWERQGVLLLNRVLTVAPGRAGSHRKLGWEEITAAVLRALNEREIPPVAILWGKDAQAAATLMPRVPVIASPHPSPLSAYRGFFGSRPFSQANELLQRGGSAPVDWQL